jgi:hypothetical protein
MRKLQFTVTVKFSDKVTDDNEVVEVANKIADAVHRQAMDVGLAPDFSDAYTKSVEVKPHFVDKTVVREIP